MVDAHYLEAEPKADLTPARIPPAPAPMTMTFIGLYSSTENSPKRGEPVPASFASLEGADIAIMAGAWERRGCDVNTPGPIFISSPHGDALAHVSNSTACPGRLEIDVFFARPRASDDGCEGKMRMSRLLVFQAWGRADSHTA